MLLLPVPMDSMQINIRICVSSTVQRLEKLEKTALKHVKLRVIQDLHIGRVENV